ncbi:MAG: DNA repair protein RecO [Elusimicrobiota bacterium]
MRGTLVTTAALTLSRREHREADRISVLYTEAFGKIPVRFTGVNRPRGKLKALSEPMVWGEYRLFVRPGAELGIATGGKLITVFPDIRTGLASTLRGLEICELLERLTPPWSPNPGKYALATRCLSVLDRPGGAITDAAAEWVTYAFALRLFEIAGFGMRGRRVSERNRRLWELLHAGDLEEVAGLPEDRERLGRLEVVVRRAVERLTDQPLRSALVFEPGRSGFINDHRRSAAPSGEAR